MHIGIEHGGCPGDWLCLTSSCATVYHAYSNYRFRLLTCCHDIFDNAPWQVRHDQGLDRVINIDYGFHRSICDEWNVRFVEALHLAMLRELGLPSSQPLWNPQLWLRQAEVDAAPKFDRPYVVINSGWKMDYPIKNWGFKHWCDVAIYCKQKMGWDVVQIGEHNPPHHIHRRLPGAVNLLGKTNIRQLFALVYGAKMCFSHESLLHHVAAARFHVDGRRMRDFVPAVCVASGWCPREWVAYNSEAYLTMQGRIKCAAPGGCNRNNVGCCERPSRVGDETVGECMKQVRPDDVFAAIDQFKRGGLLDDREPASASSSSSQERQSP